MQVGNGKTTQNMQDKMTLTVSEPKVTIEIITPALAEEMLSHNSNNRPVKQTQVTFLANEILSNRWILTGQSITFVGKALVDGQHRLRAVIEAGKPIRSVVVRFHASANSKDIFRVIDRMVPRTFSDALSIQGESNVHLLAGVLLFIDRYYVAIERVDTNAIQIPYSSQSLAANRCNVSAQNKKLKIVKQPLSYILDVLTKYPFARQSTSFGVARKTCKPMLLTKTQWASLHYIYTDIDETASGVFLEALLTGENLSRQSPILQLRERLLSLRSDHAHNVYGMSPPFVLALCNAAWNAYRTGKPVNLKKIKPGDPIQIAK